jgi:cell division septum initiation protein DivIVA
LREYGLTVRGYKIEEVVEFLEKIAASQERIEILYNETKKFFSKWLIRLIN